MSYFIYVPGENLPQGLTPEQMQAYYSQYNPDPYLKPYQPYLQPTLTHSQNSITEYLNFRPQPEGYLPGMPPVPQQPAEPE